MAYGMIKVLKANDDESMLRRLSSACTEKELAKGQKHKVFEPSFDAKPLYTRKFLLQKLDYIHNNPVRGKWNLCTDVTAYPHSSAAFYHDGTVHSMVSITRFEEIWL